MGAQDVHLDFHIAPGALCEFTVVEVLLYVHRNRNLINGGSRGRPPRPSRSSGDLFEEYLFGLFKNYAIVSCGKFGSPYPGKAQQPQAQRHPFLSVCAVCLCSNNGVWLLVFVVATCAQMLIHACTRGMYGHRQKICRKLDMEKQSLAVPGTRTRIKLYLGFSVYRSTS